MSFLTRLRLPFPRLTLWSFCLLWAGSIRGDDVNYWLDLNGTHLQSLQLDKQKATVLVFIQPDCPISNQYAPVLNRLQEHFAPRSVAIRLVYPDPEITADKARQHRKSYELTCEALLDPHQVLVGRTGVSVTPECAVFDAEGRQVYRGRIDNRYVDFGKKRPQATRHDLQEALEALLAGKPVPQATTEAVGCYIASPETP